MQRFKSVHKKKLSNYGKGVLTLVKLEKKIHCLFDLLIKSYKNTAQDL